MKTLLTIVLLCSAASSQVEGASKTQSGGVEVWSGTADLSDHAYISSDSVCSNEAAEARRQRDLAEQWRGRYAMALQFAQKTFQCMAEGVSKTNPACAQADLLIRKLQGPLPGEVIAKKKKGKK